MLRFSRQDSFNASRWDLMKYTPDARAVEREHVCLSARITSHGGQRAVSCVIRNFSIAGANLAVPAEQPLPDEFDLQIPQRATSYRVAVVWRNEDSCGVRFLRKLQHPTG
jgi:PilZ domain